MSDLSPRDEVTCRLSDLLSAVADAVREHAVGGEYLASHMPTLRARVEAVADLVAVPAPADQPEQDEPLSPVAVDPISPEDGKQ